MNNVHTCGQKSADGLVRDAAGLWQCKTGILQLISEAVRWRGIGDLRVDIKVRARLDGGTVRGLVDGDATVFGECDEDDVVGKDAVRGVEDDVAWAGMGRADHADLRA
jgi:hypothetical protein